MKLTDDLASLSVQGGEQRSRAIALVIMSPPFHLTGAHGQRRLRAIQGLDLRFLVHTQHQRFIGRIKIEPDNVTHLVDKQRILGKLEGLTAMRSQSESLPHAMHTAATQATSRRQRASAPVRRLFRRRFQSHRQDSFNFRITEPTRRSGSRLVQQTIKPLLQKPRPPFTDHLFCYPQTARDFSITFSGGAFENDARSLGQSLSCLRSPGPALQRLSFCRRNPQLCQLSSSSHRYLLGIALRKGPAFSY